ncbi:hypothetical protein GXW78_09815 [Roseomonas terrae]|uniref:DUF3618 domain-containing protein n=1 Tax=Neoroseomonas terrae TaxID=424799 RepID=A0ABS5EG11_9PROT|nr:hypothetical protein [Neoroseomonas terrae]MBR0649959.1 hypothetical protein [Neoroseomonas terrae]
MNSTTNGATDLAESVDAALKEHEKAKDTLLELAAPSPGVLAAEVAALREQVESLVARRTAAARLRPAADQAEALVRHAGITIRDQPLAALCTAFFGSITLGLLLRG